MYHFYSPLHNIVSNITPKPFVFLISNIDAFNIYIFLTSMRYVSSYNNCNNEVLKRVLC